MRCKSDLVTLAEGPRGNLGSDASLELRCEGQARPAEVSTGPLGEGYEITFAANENFTSSFLSANTGNEQSRISGYKTTDLRLTLDSPNKNWSVTLFGTNVFDKTYYTTTVAQVLGNIIGVTSTTTGQTVFRGNLGEPARYGARLSFDF